VGTLPSTLIVARLRHDPALEVVSRRRSGETDAHVVMASRLGVWWAGVAWAMDVLTALGVVVAARSWGGAGPVGLALAGVAVVIGHAFPPYAREMAGRGLAAAAGVDLAILPLEMIVAGLLIVSGAAFRTTGLATTVAMASVPVIAAVQGQPGWYVAMGVAVFLVLMLRRLEGVGDVVRSGIGPGRAALYRCVFDSSRRPGEARRPRRSRPRATRRQAPPR
jgi:glycerol-3-phosphate acyltransferase PlsY